MIIVVALRKFLDGNPDKCSLAGDAVRCNEVLGYLEGPRGSTEKTLRRLVQGLPRRFIMEIHSNFTPGSLKVTICHCRGFKPQRKSRYLEVEISRMISEHAQIPDTPNRYE